MGLVIAIARFAGWLVLSWLLVSARIAAVAQVDGASESAALVAVDAQEGGSGEIARAAFERGVAMAHAGHWREAVSALEESLQAADRPATRFNLVWGYTELACPLEVVRHALAFLAIPEEPHRAEARQHVVRALAAALQQLGVLTTDSLPSQAELSVDGASPLQDKTTGRVYVEPGTRMLQVRLPGAPPESSQLRIAGGEVAAWPRAAQSNAAPAALSSSPTTSAGPRIPELQPSSADSAENEPAPAPPPLLDRNDADDEPARWRTRLAWSVGMMGAALGGAAIGTYVGLERRERELREADPTVPGFLSKHSDPYLRLGNAVAPIALSSGALMATGAAIAPGNSKRRPRGRAVAWSALALATGALAAGLVLILREPGHISGSVLDEPSRQAGSLCVGAAAPLFSYGLTFTIRGWRHGTAGGPVSASALQGKGPRQ